MRTTKRSKSVLINTIVFLISINSISFAQLKTEAYFGLSNRMDYASDIIEMYDKGYYITGGFEGEKGWNLKTDINLNLMYDQIFEYSIGDVGIFSSISDNNGNIYMCGYIYFPVQWPFVTKIDSCGNKVWCKILDYSDEFEFGAARDIWLTKDNEVIILTGFESVSQIDKVHLICLSADGDVQWTKPYASRNDHSLIRNPSGYSMKEINNDYYISGYCYWPYPDDTTHFFLRPLFIGIDSLFNEKWILPFAALDSVFGDAYKTIPINDSVFMGVGARTIEYQGLLMFYNKDGEDIGYIGIDNDQIGPNINGSDIRDIARINDTLFITASLFGPDEGGNPGGEFIVSLNGEIYGSNSRPNTFIPSLIKTYDNNYVIATSKEETKGDWDIYVYKIDENLNDVPFDPTPHNYDSLCPGGIQSGTIDLTNCFVWTDIGDAPSPKEYYESIRKIPIKAYPNPVSEGSVTFEYKNTEHHRNIELKCFNIYGELVHKEKVYRYQGKSVVDISGRQKGMYVAVVYSNGMPAGQCKFVVQ
ncbi:MAG: T9SS type A sorting domain-containing protein [Bacteroidales bacterium]|nr:T9SS type A sorting domain-containing protein [Bacteroidales bacterium]